MHHIFFIVRFDLAGISLTGQTISLAGYKIPVVYLIGAAAIGIGGYFLFFQKKQPAAGEAPLVAVAPDVIFSTNPANIQPPNPFTIIGQFQTTQGQPVTVKQGFYYVFMVDASGGRRFISQGTVGMMVSRFMVPVTTQGWQTGKYSVVVTDEPMSPQELQQSGPGGGGPATATPQAPISGGTYAQTGLPH